MGFYTGPRVNPSASSGVLDIKLPLLERAAALEAVEVHHVSLCCGFSLPSRRSEGSYCYGPNEHRVLISAYESASCHGAGQAAMCIARHKAPAGP